ncbi:hypothetical protein KQ307_01300 [Synechococcus sp. CS-1326]|nr:hypothetical protein [Synechococcus sp. CS-1326]
MARAAAVMTSAKRATQKPEGPFLVRCQQHGGRNVLQVNRSVKAMNALRVRIRNQSKAVADHIAADPEAKAIIDDRTTAEPITR